MIAKLFFITLDSKQKDAFILYWQRIISVLYIYFVVVKYCFDLSVDKAFCSTYSINTFATVSETGEPIVVPKTCL